MNRRKFLVSGTVAGVTAASLSVSSCGNAADSTNKTPSDVEVFAMEEKTVDELQGLMKAGTFSSKDITQLYLDRIAAIDRSGPRLGAVIELNPDALQIAEQLDQERKQGKLRGLLHGIPVLVKDNINTGDKMQTTAGALALSGNIAKQDAFIIARLREAGAVLLGKTNLSEWANFRSTSSCSGWSSRGGQTKSPYILDHNPCGSSSGSGAAVAANLCAVAIGTETDGSITCPASVSGLVGIKPTVGLLSRSGIIPISATQDTAGPMARTVRDAAILLGALTGVDDADEVTQASSGKASKDYTVFLDKQGLKGKRIGMDLKKRSKDFLVNRLNDAAIALMKQQGAEIIDVPFQDAINELGGAELKVLQCEFKDGVNKYLSTAGHQMKTVAEVIAYNKTNEEKAMPYFKQEILEECEATRGLEDPKYTQALKESRDGSRKIIQNLMAEHKLDALAGITMGPACSIDVMYGDRWGADSLTAPAAMSGFPHITVPCGMANRLPVGFSFFGGAYTEPELIRIAYAFEQAEIKREKPQFIRSFLD